MRELPYAPTPYSYTPNTALSAKINLDKEVKLAETTAERDLYDSLAEIYSIIITLDGLEKAYIKDSVPEGEYTELCNRLLKQYKGNLSDETVSKAFVDLETFKRQWSIECPRATERLRINLPATVADPSQLLPSTPLASTPHAAPSPYPSHHHTGGGGVGPGGATIPPTSSGPTNSQVLLATESFITFLDALKLGMASKDALHPLLAELIQAVNAVTERDFEGRGKIIAWLIRLNGMKAQEELDRDVEVREIQFDIEGAYRGFKGVLN